MAGLPKIALARLKAKPETPKPSVSPVGPDAFQGAVHPDANLLAAFVEKTLTESERTQVLNHLVQCAECREVVAFTLPAEAEVVKPTRAAAGWRWNLWPALRWGAMAAALGAVTVVVVLHPGMYRHQEISKETPPAVPAGNITTARQSPSPRPSALPPAETAQTSGQPEGPKSTGEMAAVGKGLATHRDQSLDDNEVRAKTKKQVTLMASSRPPATYKAENVPAANVTGEERGGAKALRAVASPEPSPPAAPAAVAAATPEDVVKADVEAQAAGAPLRATAQSVAIGGGTAGANSMEAAPAKAAPRAPAEATLRMRAPAPMGKMVASSKDMGFEAGPPAALWSVSSDGKVQRSTDAGKTLEPVDVARGIKFRAIAAIGNEVWAGGTGGALFHSVDGGATWKQTALNSEANPVTETITAIRLRDPQHLTITTSSGSQWESEDGGQHWQTKP